MRLEPLRFVARCGDVRAVRQRTGVSRQVRSIAGYFFAAGSSDAACSWLIHDQHHATAMSKDDDFEPYKKRLLQRLPESLRDDWVLVPQHTLNMAVVIGVLTGVALALAMFGFILGSRDLRLAFVVLGVGLFAANKFWPWWRGARYEDQLRRAMSEDEGFAPEAGAADDAATRS